MSHDTLSHEVLSTENENIKDRHFSYKEIISPAILMGYGLKTMHNFNPGHINQTIKTSLQNGQPHTFGIDDYIQYLPLASYFALDITHVAAKNGMKRRLITGAVSHAIMAATVNIMKSKIDVLRPDGSAYNSFPSGHTATAFVGAELLWQEYHDQSVWIGIGGYGMAAATGFFRMYNNRHWMSDVAMGTKIAYWIMPLIERPEESNENGYLFLPSWDGKNVLLTFRMEL
jgi:hypothetical protein